jgi:hypothetical protein
VYTALASSLAASGSLFLSGQPLSWRLCIGTILFHGSVGSALGMLGYEGLGFKQWRALGIGVLYAAGIIHIGAIQKIVLRAFSYTPPRENDK